MHAMPSKGKQTEQDVDHWAFIFLTGIGATAVIDLWAIARRRLLGLPAPNYGLVGRWLAHMPRGRFRHESIAPWRRLESRELDSAWWQGRRQLGRMFGRSWKTPPRMGNGWITYVHI